MIVSTFKHQLLITILFDIPCNILHISTKIDSRDEKLTKNINKKMFTKN